MYKDVERCLASVPPTILSFTLISSKPHPQTSEDTSSERTGPPPSHPSLSLVLSVLGIHIYVRTYIHTYIQEVVVVISGKKRL